MEQKTFPAKMLTARLGSESPTSKCPICLTQIDNPAFTDMCIHQFCYTCLCEWAKVKAVCPVCKQAFQTIAYNVQSYEKFDELPVKNLAVTDTHTEFRINGILSHGVTHAQDARFRYRTTMTSDYRDVLRRLEEQRIIEELRNPSVRVTLNHRPFIFSSEARKAVYRTGLRVQHLQTPTEQVFSLITPQFFSDNPACKIRLSPWLQRELDVMAELNDLPIIGDTMYLINLILSLLNTLKITSQTFYNKLYPCLRRHTLHFLQELYCFARSAPYTMPQYDSCVVYGDGTSGPIWSMWHRDKARSSSRIPTVTRDATMDHITQLPSERGFISFAVRNDLRIFSQCSATLVQGTSGTRANQPGLVDLVCESSDSNSDVEVVGQEPPWDARRPIVISDSEDEMTARGVMAKHTTGRKFKQLVSETSREHQDHRLSKDRSQNSVGFENESGHLSELSDESDVQNSRHNSPKRKGENNNAGGRRDISEMSEENASRHKTKHHRSSSSEQQHCYKNDNQIDCRKRKSKDRKTRWSHSSEEHSGHSEDLKHSDKRFCEKQGTSTEQQRRCQNLSREGSRACRKRHSEEESRAHQRINFKEQYMEYQRSQYQERNRASQRSLAKERSKAHRRSHSKEHHSNRSRKLQREYQERHSDCQKPSCSSELELRSSEALDGRLKERQILQDTKRKRRISEQTYSCVSSETDTYRTSSIKANVCHNYSVSPASSDFQGFSADNSNLSHSYANLASESPSLIGKVQERDSELRLKTDVDSSTHSYTEIDSRIYASESNHEDARTSSNFAEENNELNDASFIRKTDFWSDEEETDEDNVSRSKTLKSQIGCMLLAGNGKAASISEPLLSDEELIVIESSDCSSSNRGCFSKDCDTSEANCSYISKTRKHRSRSCTRYKKSHKKHKKERRDVSRDLGAGEASCSRESQQSSKHKKQCHLFYKNHKKERQDTMSTDSRQHDNMRNNSKNNTRLQLDTNRFCGREAVHEMSDSYDRMSREFLNVNELKFKKHFSGHKNSRLKKTKI